MCRAKGLNEVIKNLFGTCPDEAIATGTCVNPPVGCGQSIISSGHSIRESFKDDLSWEEYQISGLCQKCQDEIFDS